MSAEENSPVDCFCRRGQGAKRREGARECAEKNPLLSAIKPTVISIELRWAFSMLENRLKSRLLPFQSINEPRHRAFLRRGFVRFTVVSA